MSYDELRCDTVSVMNKVMDKVIIKVIILVPNYPSLYRDDIIEPLGALYLIAALQSRNVDAKVMDWDMWVEKGERADWFGLSITTPSYSWAQHAVKTIRSQFPRSKIVVGGPHVTFLAANTINDLRPHEAVIGEGEESLVRIVTGQSPDFRSIDDLPIPDHNSYKPHFPNWWSSEAGGSIACSRGCPRQCSFCGPSMGRRVRWRDPSLVAEEMAMSGLKQWRFIDDDIMMDGDYVRRLADSIAYLDIEFRCSAHVKSVTEEKLSLLRSVGCRQIGYGIETGSECLLYLHNKGVTPSDNTRAIEMTRDAGIIAQAYLIAGLPGESWQTVDATIGWCREANPDRVTVSTCVPYPGSDLYNNPAKYGITTIEGDFSKYMQLGMEREPLVFDTLWADRYTLANMRDVLRAELCQ